MNVSHTLCPSPGQATYLVAEREVVTRVRSKAFVISTLILLIGMHRRCHAR